MDVKFTALSVDAGNDRAVVKVKLSGGAEQEYTVKAGQRMKLTLTDDSGGVTEIEIAPGQSNVAENIEYSLKTRTIVKQAKGCAWWILLISALIIYSVIKGFFGH